MECVDINDASFHAEGKRFVSSPKYPDVPWGPPTGSKAVGREVDHLGVHHFSAETKKEWRYTSIMTSTKQLFSFYVSASHSTQYLYYKELCGTLLVAQLVETLFYKLEGCGFDSRWCH
jgi:hypothetical protein